MNDNEAMAILRRAAYELKCSLEIAKITGLESVNGITIDSYHYHTRTGHDLFMLDMQDIEKALLHTIANDDTPDAERAYSNQINFGWMD